MWECREIYEVGSWMNIGAHWQVNNYVVKSSCFYNLRDGICGKSICLPIQAERNHFSRCSAEINSHFNTFLQQLNLFRKWSYYFEINFNFLMKSVNEFREMPYVIETFVVVVWLIRSCQPDNYRADLIKNINDYWYWADLKQKCWMDFHDSHSSRIHLSSQIKSFLQIFYS